MRSKVFTTTGPKIFDNDFAAADVTMAFAVADVTMAMPLESLTFRKNFFKLVLKRLTSTIMQIIRIMDTSQAYFLEAARANASPPQKSREAYEDFPSIDKIQTLFFFLPLRRAKATKNWSSSSVGLY